MPVRSVASLWEELVTDTRFAWRSYWRNRGFTLAVVLTLGLCIAASTAIFTIVERVLIQPLPYVNGGDLLLVTGYRPSSGAPARASYPEIMEWRSETNAFATLDAFDPANVSLQTDVGAEMVNAARVTPGFFGTLGVAPRLGATFSSAHDDEGDNILITNAAWIGRFGAAADVIGRTVIIDGLPRRIIGVLPPEFYFAPVGDAEFWLPIESRNDTREERAAHWLTGLARLRSGITRQQADARLRNVASAMTRRLPDLEADRSARVVPLRDEMVGSIRRPLVGLFAASAILLLIACANIANLVLARTLGRAREVAVRTALGASRGRLLRLFFVESSVLAIAGAFVGWLCASTLVSGLASARPPRLYDQLPMLRGIDVDSRSLAFALLVALVGGILFGTLPAALTSRTLDSACLRGGDRAGGFHGARRSRRILITAELTLTFVLLAGAGLVARSLISLLALNPGFESGGVATVRVALPNLRYRDDAAKVRFFERVIERSRHIPGVTAVGAISNGPLSGSARMTYTVWGEGRTFDAAPRVVAGNYFAALRIPLRSGRTFDDLDRPGGSAVVAINESLARRLFGTSDPIGRRIRARSDSSWATIVGVVGDVKVESLDEQESPTIYSSLWQTAANRMSIMARTEMNPRSILPALRQAMHEIDANATLYGIATLDEQVRASPAVEAREYPLTLIALFALAGFALALVGVYGVIAYAVAQQRREIAIRMALGARDGDIVRSFVRDSLQLLGIAIAIGVPATILASHWITSFLFGVGRFDVVTYAFAVVLIGSAALVASYLPARRATRVDPALAFRTD